MPPDAPQVDVSETSSQGQLQPTDAPMRSGPLADLIMALRFFSRLPTGKSPHEKPDLGRIAVALPFAALIMAVIPVAIIIAGGWAGIPSYFTAALAVASMAIIGGGMMEDSLADSADGLFGGYTRERRLDILKDSRHGTYGVTALCLFLVLRVTAIGALIPVSPLVAAGVWLGANLIGRSAGLWVSVALPQARDEGTSAAAGQLPRSNYLVGLATATALLMLLGTPTSSILGVLAALAAVCLVVVGWTAVCKRLVGGQTGDLIGAAAGLGEVAALAGLLIFV